MAGNATASGYGTSANVTNGFDADAVAKWNEGRSKDLLTWQSVSSALLALVGAYKQYQMYSQMGDLATAQQKMIEQQKALALDAYNTMTKPQFAKASAFLWGYGNTWGKGIIEKVVNCGTATCEFVLDESSYNRIAVKVAGIVNKAKRTGLRAVKLGQVGICCDNSFRYDALQASLMTKAISQADQFDNERKFQWTQFYWQRNVAAASMAQNIISVGANLLTGAGSGIQSALNGMTALAGQSAQNAQLGMSALEKMGGFYGSFGTLGGMITGSQWGMNAGDRTSILSNMNQGQQGPASTFAQLPGLTSTPFGSNGGGIGGTMGFDGGAAFSGPTEVGQLNF